MHKAALSLLLSLLLFLGFALLIFSGFFERYDLSEGPRILLLAAFFITVYLIIFLLLNLRQDPVSIVQNRLKRLQLDLVEQLCEFQGNVDLGHWNQELERNREEIKARLKQGIKSSSASESENIDAIIDKSCGELLSVIENCMPANPRGAALDEEKLFSVLNRIISALPSPAPPAAPPAAAPAPSLMAKAEELVLEGSGPSKGPWKNSFLVKAMAIAEGRNDIKLREDDGSYEELEELEEPEELEELDQWEELEEVPELGLASKNEIAEEEDSSPGPGSGGSKQDMEKLASEIEFGESPAPEDAAGDEDEILEEDLEIVSPFANVALNFSALAEDMDEEADGSGVIKTLEGVPYISEEALSETKKPVNKEFKDLVDSVIK